MTTFQSYRTDVETALRGVSAIRVQEAIDLLRAARTAKRSVYLIGNGGSASTCSHFANDLVKMCGIRATPLPDMTALVTAYGNDEGYEHVFSFALDRFLRPGDVVIALSCSGKSENVVNGVFNAHSVDKVKTVVLTGHDLESPLAKLAPDILITVPFRDIRVQEDCHLVICHAITGALSLE